MSCLVLARVAEGGCRRCWVTCGRKGVKMMPARTINLAEPKTCERPAQPMQLLVRAGVKQSCPPDVNASPMSARVTKVVPVRICRRKDLERACRPKFCDCPQKLLPRTKWQYIGCIAIFTAKCATIAGLVYWTTAEGIWGGPDDTEELFKRFHESWDECPEEQEFPRLEVLKFKILDSYNRAVLTVMGLLADIPMKLSKAIKDIVKPCVVVTDEKKEPYKCPE